jgi:hypothetical protein
MSIWFPISREHACKSGWRRIIFRAKTPGAWSADSGWREIRKSGEVWVIMDYRVGGQRVERNKEEWWDLIYVSADRGWRGIRRSGEIEMAIVMSLLEMRGWRGIRRSGEEN